MLRCDGAQQPIRLQPFLMRGCRKGILVGGLYRPKCSGINCDSELMLLIELSLAFLMAQLGTHS